jgi:protein involved in polysaccharide export with SLBB domain
VDEWLTRARDALAAAGGLTPEELELDRDTQRTLLEVARIAAHESGARTNAPFVSYLVGVARERGASLHDLAEAIRALEQLGA